MVVKVVTVVVVRVVVVTVVAVVDVLVVVLVVLDTVDVVSVVVVDVVLIKLTNSSTFALFYIYRRGRERHNVVDNIPVRMNHIRVSKRLLCQRSTRQASERERERNVFAERGHLITNYRLLHVPVAPPAR